MTTLLVVWLAVAKLALLYACWQWGRWRRAALTHAEYGAVATNGWHTTRNAYEATLAAWTADGERWDAERSRYKAALARVAALVGRRPAKRRWLATGRRAAQTALAALTQGERNA